MKLSWQKQLSMCMLGSIAGALLWKEHRVWGFLLGGAVVGHATLLAFDVQLPGSPAAPLA